MSLSTARDPALYERLTPDNAALLLIDHQTGLMLGVGTMEATKLRNNALAFAQLGKVFGLPAVVTTSASSGPNGPLMAEITEMYGKESVINRHMVNAWDDPRFVAAVEKTGRRKLIMGAITTDVCLLFPALAATAAGYDVYAVADASGTWDALSEQTALLRLTQAGVKVCNWVSVAAELLRDWEGPYAKAVGQLLAERLGPYHFLANNSAAK